MKMQLLQVLHKDFEIQNINDFKSVKITSDDIDPLTLIYRDIAPGFGQILVVYYNQFYGYTFDGMGQDNIIKFLSESRADYLIKKMKINFGDRNIAQYIIDAMEELYTSSIH